MCFLLTRTPKLSGTTLTGELACQNSLYSALPSQKLLFQFFLPISQLTGCSQSTIHHSLLTPANLRFLEIVCHGQKKLKKIQEMSRRSTMTRPWWECTYKRFSKGKGGETVGGGKSEVPERKGFHRRYQHRSGEWPVGECQETRSGPRRLGLNGSWHSPQGSAALKKSRHVEWPKWWRRCIGQWEAWYKQFHSIH